MSLQTTLTCYATKDEKEVEVFFVWVISPMNGYYFDVTLEMKEWRYKMSEKAEESATETRRDKA